MTDLSSTRLALTEICHTVRGYKGRVGEQARQAREIQQLMAAAAMLKLDKPNRAKAAEACIDMAQVRELCLEADTRLWLARWPALLATHAHGTGCQAALPRYEDQGEILQWLMLENLPGHFPYTAGTCDPEPATRPGLVCDLQAPACGAVQDPGLSALVDTLACGFMLLEACLARGQPIDDIAARLVFDWRLGEDLWAAVLPRVARRVWAVVLKERYAANEHGQQLKTITGRAGNLPCTGTMPVNALTDETEQAVLQGLQALADNDGALEQLAQAVSRALAQGKGQTTPLSFRIASSGMSWGSGSRSDRKPLV